MQRLDHVIAHPFQAGFSQAMDLVFLVGGSVLILALVLAVFLKEVPLRRVSGIEAARAEAAAAGAPDPGGATHDVASVASTVSTVSTVSSDAEVGPKP